MYLKILMCILSQLICSINGSLLFWSKTPFQVSPLKNFNDQDFDELVHSMGNPETHIYKTVSLLPEFKQLLKGYYSFYNPNGELTLVDNILEVSNDDLEISLKKLSGETQHSTLFVVIIPNERPRHKRQTDNSTTESSMEEYKSGPVLYKTSYKNRENTQILMYSSQSVLLQVKDVSHYLGQPSDYMMTVDIRDQITKLNVNVPQEDGRKVTLNFLFYWSKANYWSLSAVKVSDTNQLNYNLTLEPEISAPAHFSYHCSGDTVFRDIANDVELHLYDLQVQIDSQNERFSDADDCVPFTTIPIWSGLLITALLGLVLIIGLAAIFDIKTMDKFDNYKTKQLTITVAE